MNNHIPASFFERVTIKRATIDTRNTFTTVASDVELYIQRDSGGLQIEGMQVAAGNQFTGFPKVIISGVAEGDFIDRSTGKDLYVTHVENYPDYQELGLTDNQERGRM